MEPLLTIRPEETCIEDVFRKDMRPDVPPWGD